MRASRILKTPAGETVRLEKHDMLPHHVKRRGHYGDRIEWEVFRLMMLGVKREKAEDRILGR